MVASNIKVFVRVRPSAKPSKAFSVTPDESILNFELEKHTPEGQVNNSKTNYKYKFDGILGMKVSQEEVFNVVAKPVIEDVLQGINGTIFAYGQTGSGKTFTITGGSERYADRGLIPRTIAYLFDAFKQRSDATYRLYISYLEIYNNDGYDLLSRETAANNLEDLPKVTLREDDEGNIHLRNLSVNMAQKAEDALNLLFLGDTNRVVAETPMNDASTRSHCMFILWVDSTKPDSDTVRRAKLHLVDLAGSERISKTGVEGNLQKEARYINLSLFYLEQVIVALHNKSQGKASHVPYRNSMMTSVLRDSLGGNCKTVMVGAMAVEDRNIDESISTCNFAQRVACIKNNAIINEELDPALLIKRLKREVAELKDELTLLSSDGQDEEELTEADTEECQKLVKSYLADLDPQAPFVCGSAKRFRECFRILRDVYWQREAEGFVSDLGGSAVSSTVPGSSPANGGGGAALSSLEAKVLALRQEVVTRDKEIGMLVNSLGRRGGQAAHSAAKDGRPFIKANPPGQGQGQGPQGPGQGRGGGQGEAQAGAEAEAHLPTKAGTAGVAGVGADSAGLRNRDSATLLLDRNHAFEVFRKSVRRAEAAEENKETGKKLVEEATGLGERANLARTSITQKQSRIEKLRMERLLNGCSPHDPEAVAAGGPPPDSPEILQLLREIEEHTAVYHQCTSRLKQVKAELNSCMRASEQNKQRLQQDFEAWYAALHASSGSSAGLPGAAEHGTTIANPGPTSQHPLPPRRATPEEQPVRAWGASPHGSPVSEGSSARSSSRKTTSAPHASAPAAPSTAPPVPAPAAAPPAAPLSSSSASAATPGAEGAPRLTGHAQTDSEIAAFYAAMADLR